jgi:signal transduction histidine kinase/response regulator of citrate/malate metabolism
MKILHLEDDPGDSMIIERGVQRQGIEATFIRARSPNEFTSALEAGGFDVVVVDNGLPSFSACDAIVQAKSTRPDIPIIVCSGAARDTDVAASFAVGACDYVLKDYSWQLAAALRRNVAPSAAGSSGQQQVAMLKLVEVVQELSLARGLDAIVEIVRHAARELTGADGATFVLRDGQSCHYVDEDAISPLWKGQRLPLQACISGWAMSNGRSTIIPDIHEDSRIAPATYQPTFVRSLVMVPIRPSAPIGAIGNYWATHHECTAEELMLLEALANATAVAMENVNVYQSLENQVRERTRELQVVNQEMEAFSSAVSHDLRAPLRAMNAELEMASEKVGLLTTTSIGKLREATGRMAGLIDDLLRLSRISRAELQKQPVDLDAVASEVMARLRIAEPHRQLELDIDAGPEIDADPGLIRVVLENLLSNAWKYSSKRDVSRIEFTSGRDEAGRCVYRVSDNGAGFNARYADRLFKPFSRLHDNRDFPGIGIGLATVHRIIQRHGGDIWAHSDGVSGAQFMFTLPTTKLAAES